MKSNFTKELVERYARESDGSVVIQKVMVMGILGLGVIGGSTTFSEDLQYTYNSTANGISEAVYTAQSDTIQGGESADRIDAGEGDDTIDGGGGDDEINGGEGNDRINGGDGDDTLDGGDGDDFIVGGLGSDIIRGGEGFDTVDYSGSTTGVVAIFEKADRLGVGWHYRGAESGGYVGEAGGDKYTSIEAFKGSEFGDRVYGSSKGTKADLGGGNDVFDTSAHGTRDEINGGDGHDTVISGGGDDLIEGGKGNDRLVGENGNDEIFGGPGNDRIQGGRGNDRLIGGTGNDVIVGSWGEDTFVYHSGDGSDRVYGGGQHDVLELVDYKAYGEAGGWTLELIRGAIESSDPEVLRLRSDTRGAPAGKITFTGGAVMTFYDIEEIRWPASEVEEEETPGV